MALAVEEKLQKYVDSLRHTGKDSYSHLKSIFAAMDVNKDHTLDASELKTCFLALGLKLSAAEIKLFIEKHDKSGDGKLDYDEFLQWQMSAHKVVEVAKTKAINVTSAYGLKMRLTDKEAFQGQEQHVQSIVDGVLASTKSSSFRTPTDGRPRLSTEVGDYVEHVKSLEQTLALKVEELEETEVMVDQLKHTLQKTQSSGISLAEELAIEVDEKVSNISEVQAEVQKLSVALTANEELEAALELELADRRAQLAANQKKQTEKNQMIITLQKAQEENEAQMEELNEAMGELKSELEETEKQIKACEERVDEYLSADGVGQSIVMKPEKKKPTKKKPAGFGRT